MPFHTWLPDLYESAPVPVLVFFAGLVSKLGAYGFIRFGLTLFPDAINTFKWVLAALAVLSIIYGALMALSETDLKRIVAYSSISHLGFIALGIFTLNSNGVNGAVHPDRQPRDHHRRALPHRRHHRGAHRHARPPRALRAREADAVAVRASSWWRRSPVSACPG